MARRWFRILAAILGLCLIAAVAAPALAQEKPAASGEKLKIEPAQKPKLENPRLDPIEVYCTEEDKQSAILAIEEGLALAREDLKKVNDWSALEWAHLYALRRLGSAADADMQANRFRDSQGARFQAAATVAQFERALARAKARKIIDCRDPRRIVPPAPPLEKLPGGARKAPCTQAELEAYLKELQEEEKAAALNQAKAEDYLAELDALIEAAKKPGSLFGKALPQLTIARDAYEGVVKEQDQAVGDVRREIERARKQEPVDCPKKAVTPPPGPSAPAPDAPKPESPKPGPLKPEPPKPASPGTPPRPEGPKPGDGHGSLPWSPHRPPFPPAGLPAIPAFCDEFARNGFLNGAMLPELARANANVGAANAYLTELNAEFAEANRAGAPVAQVVAIKQEIDAYGAVARETQARAADLQAEFQAALHQPLGAACPVTAAAPRPPPPVDRPSPPVAEAPPPSDGARPCHCLDRRPIEVGANAKVGSGARARDKAVSTAVGLVGGLLGGGGGGGGGGGSDGPKLSVCRIADKEMTVFDDPATGVSLKVGAKRSGDKVVVFADVAKSPDDGTFQAAWLQDGDGARQAPRDLGICELWGEWKLTVSWTRTTYVNDQVVSRESGGWSRSGEFHIPGTISTAAAPDGLWKRLGFSNASHGARRIALTYDAPRAKLAAGPLGLVIHVTRPGQNPVTTAPFALMLRETPTGFVVERPPACLCDGAVKGSFSDVPVQETEVAPIDYRTGDEQATRRKVPGLPKTAPKPAEPPKTAAAPPAEMPRTATREKEEPFETDAETEARRAKSDAAQDRRFAETAPKREAYDKRIDEIAKGAGPAGGADTVEHSGSLDEDGLPTDAKLDYFRKDFPLPIYTVTVDGEGHVTGSGYTPAYRAYMTMKAAVKGERMWINNSFASGPDGSYIDHAWVKDADGNVRGEFTFGPDGNAKTGEIYDAEHNRVGVLNNP
ncbi:hypothetical protein [Phenylobacterium sp.]|uniref:hypothetical protein n=1 Tax=Phenylobacterium sp. TaxID=1871053 RepID=UPI003566AAE1